MLLRRRAARPAGSAALADSVHDVRGSTHDARVPRGTRGTVRTSPRRLNEASPKLSMTVGEQLPPARTVAGSADRQGTVFCPAGRSPCENLTIVGAMSTDGVVLISSSSRNSGGPPADVRSHHWPQNWGGHGWTSHTPTPRLSLWLPASSPSGSAARALRRRGTRLTTDNTKLLDALDSILRNEDLEAKNMRDDRMPNMLCILLGGKEELERNAHSEPREPIGTSIQ